MKTYLRNKNNRRRRYWFYVFIIIAVFGLLVSGARGFITKIVVSFFYPALNSKESLSAASGWAFIPFRDKKKLADELAAEKERNASLEAFMLELESLKKENEELKSVLSQTNKKSYILGTIILRPPQSPYDTIMVDAGSENGVETGAKVMAYSNVIVGYVAEVYPKASKIKMLSFPGEQTNVSFENSNVFSLSAGLGGGNMEIKIPNSVSATTGDKIMTVGTFPMVVGLVEKIEADKINPFQRIIFRTPINLSSLKNILIEK